MLAFEEEKQKIFDSYASKRWLTDDDSTIFDWKCSFELTRHSAIHCYSCHCLYTSWQQWEKKSIHTHSAYTMLIWSIFLKTQAKWIPNYAHLVN